MIIMSDVYLENMVLNKMNNIYSLERSIELKKSVSNLEIEITLYPNG